MKFRNFFMVLASIFTLFPCQASMAGQKSVNTCENETRQVYDPIQGRMITKTEMVCRPRLRHDNISYDCRSSVVYRYNNRTGQIGSQMGQDCAPNPSTQKTGNDGRETAHEATGQKVAIDIQRGTIPGNILGIVMNTYNQTCR